MTDISVVVVNWNASEDLRACLLSLFAAPAPAASFDVWVVDNASTDGSVQMVREQFPNARLIANDANLGFSKANNQALRETTSRYALLLNSDAVIHPGALDALMQWADAHPKAGILGPKVLNPDGSLQLSCRRFPSLGAGFFRNTYLGRLFPRNKYAADYLMADFDHASARPVDWVSGCAMLLRRNLLGNIGLLDEQFFMYCEDVDICERAWRSGWEVVYVPDAVVTHAIGRSSDKNAERMVWEFHRAWLLYDRKRHPRGGIIRGAAVQGGLWLRAWARILRRRSAERARARQAADSAPPTAVPTRPKGTP